MAVVVWHATSPNQKMTHHAGCDGRTPMDRYVGQSQVDVHQPKERFSLKNGGRASSWSDRALGQ